MQFTWPQFLLCPPPLLPLTSRSTPTLLPCREDQVSKRQQPNMTNQDTIRQGENHHTETEQGNRIRIKESQGQANEPQTHPLPLLRVSQKHQGNSRNMRAEDQVLTHAGPVLGISVSVSRHEPWLVDLHVLPVGALHPLWLLPFSLPLLHTAPRPPSRESRWRPQNGTLCLSA